MFTPLRCAVGVIALAMLAGGCATTPESQGDRVDLDQQVKSAMNRFNSQDPGLQKFLDSAAGYAVFGDVGEGAFGVGGAYGKGEVFQKGTMIGFTSITKANIGIQLGGQSFNELLVFENDTALENFKAETLTFDAGAKAVAIKTGASAEAKYNNHVMVFSDSQAGLMAGVDVGGQNFTFSGLPTN